MTGVTTWIYGDPLNGAVGESDWGGALCIEI
jgi:hypothetical protein